MGEFADAVGDRLRDALAERRPSLNWRTEYRVRRTPVDVVGADDDRFVAVEVEWRRADPANNTAKLFYYADEGEFSEYDEVVVCQLFSGYYDLASGRVSSKREVAEFVGRTAAESVGRVSFHPIRLPIDPPKRGGGEQTFGLRGSSQPRSDGERAEGWRARTDQAASDVASLL